MTPQLKTDYPASNRINDEPMVFLLEDFVSPEETAHLIELARPNLKPATVSGRKDGETSEGRTGGVAWIQHGQTTMIQVMSERRSHPPSGNSRRPAG